MEDEIKEKEKTAPEPPKVLMVPTFGAKKRVGKKVRLPHALSEGVMCKQITRLS
jgi:hypothetical protein